MERAPQQFPLGELGIESLKIARFILERELSDITIELGVVDALIDRLEDD